MLLHVSSPTSSGGQGAGATPRAAVEEAQSILDDALPGGAVVLYYARILLAGSRGDVEEARRLAAEGLRLTELRDDRTNPVRIRWALGHVELARGDAAAAWEVLDGTRRGARGYRDRASRAGTRSSPTWSRRSCCSAALDEAERRSRALEAQAARSSTGGRPRSRSGAGRCSSSRGERAEEAADGGRAVPPRCCESSASRSTKPARSSSREPRDAAPGQRRLAAAVLQRAIEILDGVTGAALARASSGRAPASEPAPAA